METIYLSLRAHVAVSNFFMKSPVGIAKTTLVVTCINKLCVTRSNITAKLSRNLFIDMKPTPHFRCRRRIVFMSAFYMYCLLSIRHEVYKGGSFSTIIEGTSPAVKGLRSEGIKD